MQLRKRKPIPPQQAHIIPVGLFGFCLYEYNPNPIRAI
jgi:hypothetical protein